MVKFQLPLWSPAEGCNPPSSLAQSSAGTARGWFAGWKPQYHFGSVLRKNEKPLAGPAENSRNVEVFKVSLPPSSHPKAPALWGVVFGYSFCKTLSVCLSFRIRVFKKTLCRLTDMPKLGVNSATLWVLWLCPSNASSKPLFNQLISRVIPVSRNLAMCSFDTQSKSPPFRSFLYDTCEGLVLQDGECTGYN